MLKLVVFASILATISATCDPPFEEIFRWKSIDYNWPSSRHQRQAYNTQDYIQANNAISGIKLWKDEMYLSIPRWKKGVPVTLSVTSAIPVNGNISPKLDPYPNWEMQSLGNCSAFQFVQSMEIDPLGRMWVLDSGRTDTMTPEPTAKCPPRLVILDLEIDGEVLLSYTFPEDVAHKESTVLNDIVIDHEDGGMAYITDSGSTDPGIIVFSLANKNSWKVRHNSMEASSNAVGFVVAGTRVTERFNINGIALSPPGPNRLVYYSRTSSLYLYSIPTSALKNSSLKDVDRFVTRLGRKDSQTDGMVMTNENSIYLGLLADDAIGQWNPVSHPSITTGLREVYVDHERMQWPDSFGVDQDGRLWCTANRHQNYFNNYFDITETNFRVTRSNTSAKSYQYFKNGSAPQLPDMLGHSIGFPQLVRRKF